MTDAIPPAALPGRGVSAPKLARLIRRRLMLGPMHGARSGPTRPGAYSLTLTCRSGDEGELRRALADFVAVVERRAPEVGLLCALDRAPETGRWHVHALALVPPSRAVDDVVRWWRRRWPLKGPSGAHLRPSWRAQHVRPLATRGAPLANHLDRVLSHHLGRARKGVPIPGLPPLLERVTARGGLGRVWARVCHDKKVPGAPPIPKPAKRPPRLTKVSTIASRPVQRWASGLTCAWCAKALPVRKREGAKDCGRPCGAAASRALRAFERRTEAPHAAEAVKRVLKLEQRGWLRRDALHAVEAALAKSLKSGIAFGLTRVQAPRCRCKEPLARRMNATTCGRAKCRMKELRRRRREGRKRARVEELFQVLLKTKRTSAFSQAEVHALAAAAKVRPRDADHLLRELAADALVKWAPPRPPPHDGGSSAADAFTTLGYAFATS